MHPQEFGAAHSLHSSTIDGQWWVFSVAFPEVNHNLLCFADIQQEVVVSAPRGQKVDLLPVVGLIVLGDETHQSCVVYYNRVDFLPNSVNFSSRSSNYFFAPDFRLV